MGRVWEMLEFNHYPPGGKVPKGKWPDVVRGLIAQDGGAGSPEIIEALLCWLQDFNWPGSKEAEAYLLTLGEKVIPHVARVLEGDDEMWQYWVLGYMRSWPTEHVQRIVSRVNDLAMQDADCWDKMVVNTAAVEVLIKKDLLAHDTARAILSRTKEWRSKHDSESEDFRREIEELRALIRSHEEGKEKD